MKVLSVIQEVRLNSTFSE